MSEIISVIIPCYNQGRFLAQAIDSVLSQTHPSVEIIVVDDGSTDETPEIAARYGSAVTYVRQENRGLGAARNCGISLAKGSLLHFLDSDDALDSEMLGHQAATADAHPEAGAFYGVWRRMTETGEREARSRVTLLPNDQFHGLQRCNVAPPCCVTVRRRALDVAGVFETNPEIRGSEDWDLWLRISAAGFGFVFAPESVAFYRSHSEAMSRDHEKMWLSGRAALTRSMTYHGDCHRCRMAVAAGLRALQHYCYHRAVKPALSGEWHGGRRAAAARRLAHYLRHHPKSAGIVARAAIVGLARVTTALPKRLIPRGSYASISEPDEIATPGRAVKGTRI